MAAIFGRDETGIGGGGPPSNRADGEALVRVGSAGLLGSGGTDFGCDIFGTVGKEIGERMGSLGVSSTGSFGLRAGNGGREAGSYSGARTLLLLPTLTPDVVDMADMVESLDPLLCQWYEDLRSTAGPLGRLGGNCGEGSSVVAVDVLRGGKTGVSSTESTLNTLLGLGGGLNGCRGRTMPIDALPYDAGLTTPPFVVFPFATGLLGRAGRLGSGGGGPLFLLTAGCSEIALS
jgi:hypothetical protein